MTVRLRDGRPRAKRSLPPCTILSFASSIEPNRRSKPRRSNTLSDHEYIRAQAPSYFPSSLFLDANYSSAPCLSSLFDPSFSTFPFITSSSLRPISRRLSQRQSIRPFTKIVDLSIFPCCCDLTCSDDPTSCPRSSFPGKDAYHRPAGGTSQRQS